jgi:hypothetical protein
VLAQDVDHMLSFGSEFRVVPDAPAAQHQLVAEGAPSR